MSRTTISNYLAVLEATFVVDVVWPFSSRRPTEIISAPKVYAFDTGFMCYYIRLISFAIVVLVILQAVPAKAEEPGKYRSYLRPNEPSYLVWAGGPHEEGHAEFFLSLKYPLFDWRRNILYFIYNGKYDFFVESRESSPVISRRQNPGLSLVHVFEETSWLNNAGIGWFHESNGQVIDNRESFQATEHAEDYVSRGWDYLGIDFKGSAFKKVDMIQDKSLEEDNRGDVNYAVSFRYFCDCQAAGTIEGREDRVFWEDVRDQPSITDYDGIRLAVNFIPDILIPLEYVPDIDLKFSLMLRTGYTEALQHWSTRVGATFRMGRFPLTVFYFTGYGSEIATYHKYDDYIGIGLELW